MLAKHSWGETFAGVDWSDQAFTKGGINCLNANGSAFKGDLMVIMKGLWPCHHRHHHHHDTHCINVT